MPSTGLGHQLGGSGVKMALHVRNVLGNHTHTHTDGLHEGYFCMFGRSGHFVRQTPVVAKRLRAYFFRGPLRKRRVLCPPPPMATTTDGDNQSLSLHDREDAKMPRS